MREGATGTETRLSLPHLCMFSALQSVCIATPRVTASAAGASVTQTHTEPQSSASVEVHAPGVFCGTFTIDEKYEWSSRRDSWDARSLATVARWMRHLTSVVTCPF